MVILVDEWFMFWLDLTFVGGAAQCPVLCWMLCCYEIYGKLAGSAFHV